MKIPPVCEIRQVKEVKALHGLHHLYLYGCKRLASLPELPCSLTNLAAHDCESLETVFCPLNTPNAQLKFINCFKLGQNARRAIIQPSFLHETTLLPGREVPTEFDHQGKRNTLTIHPDDNPYTSFVVCDVISPNQQITKEVCYSSLLSCRIIQGDLDPVDMLLNVSTLFSFRTEHLFIFHSRWLYIDPSEVGREIAFEFGSKHHNFDVIECAAKILTDESFKGRYESGLDNDRPPIKYTYVRKRKRGSPTEEANQIKAKMSIELSGDSSSGVV